MSAVLFSAIATEVCPAARRACTCGVMSISYHIAVVPETATVAHADAPAVGLLFHVTVVSVQPAVGSGAMLVVTLGGVTVALRS